MEHFKDNSGCSGPKKNQKYSGTILEKFNTFSQGLMDSALILLFTGDQCFKDVMSQTCSHQFIKLQQRYE